MGTQLEYEEVGKPNGKILCYPQKFVGMYVQKLDSKAFKIFWFHHTFGLLLYTLVSCRLSVKSKKYRSIVQQKLYSGQIVVRPSIFACSISHSHIVMHYSWKTVRYGGFFVNWVFLSQKY